MAKHKTLLMDDFEISNFKLIGIHVSLEAYKLAFLINKHLAINFERMNDDLDFKFGEIKANFPIFHYYNKTWDAKSYLISNVFKYEEQKPKTANVLFDAYPEERIKHLIPEYPKVDFLMKINDDLDIFDIKIIIDDLLKIKQISTAFQIEQNKLKHPENLILD
ncbi:MAG: IPExxxVDY family protein [Psychroflexus sp.]